MRLTFLSVFGTIIFLFLGGFFPNSLGEVTKYSMEGGMDLEISYPSSSLPDRKFSVSILIKNSGWEEKRDVFISFQDSNGPVIPINFNEVKIESISPGGSFGKTIDFQISKDVTEGLHFINFLYSQIIIRNEQEQEVSKANNIAIPINIKNEPIVNVYATTPQTIFPNAEFPFNIEIKSEDIDLKDVNIQINSPNNFEFIGEEIHSFSIIKKNEPVVISSQFVTPKEDIATEHKIPFDISLSYIDDLDKERKDSKTVVLTLRPRNFMEITNDGGFWIGQFFIAPYVSIGTLVGIPAGTLFSLALKRAIEKKKKKSTTKSRK